MKVFFTTIAGVCALVASGSGQFALAKTLCVNPGGTSGCSSTIGAAVANASGGDIINVGRGVYKEQVSIKIPLSLIGEDAENTVIDATGKINGITITNTSQVVVSGFTVENAETAGIWITGSSYVSILRNQVVGNDKALVTGASPSCPPLENTPFARGEGMDCGEGVFLSNVDHCLLAGNTITGNAGGILLADDTGPTHDNWILANSVVRNTQADCGITIPSHNPVAGGVYHNTVADNDSSYNGGPGVGIFAPIPGTKAYGNIVKNNRLIGNALPGVTMHNHVPNGTPGFPPAPAVFDDNQIVGNVIAANGADDDPATSGPAGIRIASTVAMNGTVIAGNSIDRESLDIALDIPNSLVLVELNNLNGNQQIVGIQNSISTTVVNARMNWWGCSKGPNTPGCTTLSGSGIQSAPWLTTPGQANNE